MTEEMNHIGFDVATLLYMMCLGVCVQSQNDCFDDGNDGDVTPLDIIAAIPILSLFFFPFIFIYFLELKKWIQKPSQSAIQCHIELVQYQCIVLR